MFRVNDGKPSVSRRKSSAPQKRIINALTMVNKVDGKNVSTTDSVSTPMKEKHPSAPHGATTSKAITERSALDGKKLEAAETNATHNFSLPMKVQSRNEALSVPAKDKTAIDSSFYGRDAQKKQLDVHALYADHSQTSKVVDSSCRGLLPLPPPASSPRKKNPVEILPPSMPSVAKKLEVIREGQGCNKGKKIVDVHKLYGPSQDHGLKQFKKVVEDRPSDTKRKSVQTSSNTSTTSAQASANITLAGVSSHTHSVTEMEPEEIKSERPEPEFVDVKELKHTASSVLSMNTCSNLETMSMNNSLPLTTASTVKKRVRKLNSDSGQPAPKKRAASTSSKKRGDVGTIYRARKVYESDCTSNAASDTGTLPQGNVANRKANVCPYQDCRQSFSRPWRLAAHIRKHKGERPYRCVIDGCSRDYSNPSHLRRHIHRNHSLEPLEKLKCPSDGCFMTLASAATLKRHIERRHGPANFECEICKEKFRKHGELRIHKLTHDPTVEMLYKCETCESGFIDNRLYKKHLRSHRTYPCQVVDCKQVFGTWTAFLKHTKNDHPASKFECAICSRVFTVKKNLEFHLETHKDFSERVKLTCQFRNCNKFYFQQRNLTAHVKRCHCNDTFDCPFPNCESKLSTKQKLILHMESVHGLARDSIVEFIKKEASIQKPPESGLIIFKQEPAD